MGYQHHLAFRPTWLKIPPPNNQVVGNQTMEDPTPIRLWGKTSGKDLIRPSNYIGGGQGEWARGFTR